DEDRRNGTLLQTNSTRSARLALGGTHDLSGGSLRADWRLFGGTQAYRQSFTAVTAGRSVETLTRTQRSPARDFGGSFQLTAFRGGQTFVFGTEGRSIRGASDEVGYFGGNPTSLLGTGGRERSGAGFAHGIFVPHDRLVISAGARFDAWRNDNGYRQLTPLGAGSSETT